MVIASTATVECAAQRLKNESGLLFQAKTHIMLCIQKSVSLALSSEGVTSGNVLRDSG